MPSFTVESWCADTSAQGGAYDPRVEAERGKRAGEAAARSEWYHGNPQRGPLVVADTVYVGLTASLQLGPVSGGWFAGITVDDSLNVVVASGWAVGAGAGAHGVLGAQVQTSNAVTAYDTEGPFGNASIGAGLGPYASYDRFWGASDHGEVIGRGFTFGFGAGGGFSAGGSQTYITPISSPIVPTPSFTPSVRPFYNIDYSAP